MTPGPNGVIAVTQDISTAGAIVWWRLSGECLASELAAALEDGGVNAEPPDDPSPPVALRRAFNTLKRPRRLPRPTENHDGFVLVDEDANGAELTYAPLLTAKVNSIGRLTVEEHIAILENDLRSKLEDAYEKALHELSPPDVSSWMVRLVERHLDGVRLRDTGGIYFVPRNSMDEWHAVVRAVREASMHCVYEVPALQTHEAVDAILAALNDEATAEAEAISKEMEENPTAKRAENRLDKVEALEEKLSRYERLLDASADGTRAALEKLRAQLALAALKDNGEEIANLFKGFEL